MDKHKLSESDISDKFVRPAMVQAGWHTLDQIYAQFPLRAGRVVVRGNKSHRDKDTVLKADFALFLKPNIPLAVVEVKKASLSPQAGMQQAIQYAELLDVPFSFASNGDGFIFRDATLSTGVLEQTLTLDQFPSPQELWARYCAWKGWSPEVQRIAAFDYSPSKTPRYYQLNAINRTVEAIAAGQHRALLVMATGTGKTYTAFQIIWRLWKSGAKKRILFLADRNILIDQTMVNDFRPFKGAMAKLSPNAKGVERVNAQGQLEVDDVDLAVDKTTKAVNKSYEIYLSLYQAVTGTDEEQNIYKQFSPDFFDLIVVDECHRGSANEDSAWRDILTYFSSATHVGLTATPKETKDTSNTFYFGEPIYTYSLKQGIEDGFLAPYKVIRVDLDKDTFGWRPTAGMTDNKGQLIEDRVYTGRDMNRKLVMEPRDAVVAERITAYLRATDRMAKTIVFCEDIDHAARMRQALSNANADICATQPNYVVQITGDNPEGKRELDNFIDPEKDYPVIATTSKLMSTGVDAQTCKLIVLDQNIKSMTLFKQIIGRGTRLREDLGKSWFTILDFKRATDNFADPAFDGEPVQIYEPQGDDPIAPPDTPPDMPPEPFDPANPTVRPEPVEGPPLGPFGGTGGTPVIKYVLGNQVTVAVARERVQYLNAQGKLITESLRDYTRVEELMRLCDALEAKGQLEVTQHAQLVSTLLATLTDSETPAQLADNWHRIATHFDLLLDRPEAVDALEQTILQLAVHGLLVPQDPQDEPASELLKKIRAEKDKLILEGKIKRDKPLAPIAEDEQPFALPVGWSWARWADVALKIGDIDHKMPNEAKEGVPYVSPRDFYGANEIDFDGAKKIAYSDYLELSSKIRPELGDLIYPRYGTIGVVRKVVEDREFLASYSCAVIKVFSGFVEPDYQYLFSVSGCAKEQAASATNKTTQPNVGLKSIQEFLVPLPPLAEQSRIVTRVAQLRRLCADLRQRLAASQSTQAHLAEALVQSKV